jgi:hypothetical protein
VEIAPDTYSIRIWVGPIRVLDAFAVRKKSYLCRDFNPNSSLVPLVDAYQAKRIGYSEALLL